MWVVAFLAAFEERSILELVCAGFLVTFIIDLKIEDSGLRFSSLEIAR